MPRHATERSLSVNALKAEIEKRMEATVDRVPEPAPAAKERPVAVKKDPPVKSGERFDFTTQKWT
jgi:hypothetical protein